MLDKERRLGRSAKVTDKKITTSFFSLNISKNSGAISRFSFIFTKKIDKRAVVRNSTRRKVRSVIEELIKEVKDGKDFVFIIKKGAVDAKREDVLKMVKEVFLKNNLLK